MKDDYLTIRCTGKLKDAVRKAAKEQDRTIAGVITVILKKALKVKE